MKGKHILIQTCASLKQLGAINILAATKQLSEHFCPSARPFVTRFFHNVRLIVSPWIVQELLPLTKTMSMHKVKVRG